MSRTNKKVSFVNGRRKKLQNVFMMTIMCSIFHELRRHSFIHSFTYLHTYYMVVDAVYSDQFNAASLPVARDVTSDVTSTQYSRGDVTGWRVPR